MRLNKLTNVLILQSKNWTLEEDDMLKSKGSELTNKELSILLNRSINSIRWRLYYKHKIYKSKEAEFKARSIASKGRNIGSYEKRFGEEKALRIKQKLSVSCGGINNGFYNKKHTEQTKDKTRNNTERAKRISEKLKGRITSPKTLFQKGDNNPTKQQRVKDKLKIACIRRYELYPESHPNRLLARNKKTFIEKEFYDLLNGFGFKENIDYVYNKSIKTPDGYKYPDFCFENKKIIFEVDGKYWHKDKHKDLLRDISLIKCGYKVIHFSDDDILKNRKEVIGKIKMEL